MDLSGASQERPIIAAGLAGMRSTRYVEFHTGRPRYPVQKCHLNAAVYDTQTWEQATAAKRWCVAVNNDGRFGRWSYHLVRHPADLGTVIDKQSVAPVPAAA